jgi:hypothetical protein
VVFALALCVLASTGAFASSHREAPITALDRTADITDWYAFVSYDHPDRVTMILNVDPFLEPSNGPNYFPFDPYVLYEMKIDIHYTIGKQHDSIVITATALDPSIDRRNDAGPQKHPIQP